MGEPCSNAAVRTLGVGPHVGNLVAMLGAGKNRFGQAFFANVRYIIYPDITDIWLSFFLWHWWCWLAFVNLFSSEWVLMFNGIWVLSCEWNLNHDGNASWFAVRTESLHLRWAKMVIWSCQMIRVLWQDWIVPLLMGNKQMQLVKS